MIHYSTKHEVKKTFKKIIWQQIGGWKMEMDASMRSFQNMGKILILEAYTYNNIYTHESIFRVLLQVQVYVHEYVIPYYNIQQGFQKQLCKIPMWLPFRINNISPKKIILSVLNTRLKNKSYPGEDKIISILKVYS